MVVLKKWHFVYFFYILIFSEIKLQGTKLCEAYWVFWMLKQISIYSSMEIHYQFVLFLMFLANKEKEIEEELYNS